MQELGPGVVDEIVFDDGLDSFAAPGDALDHALCFFASARGVEQDQLAHARHAVMSRDDGGEAVRIVGDWTRVKHGVRPVAVAAVEFALPRAVGVHREEESRDVMHDTAIFPAQVHDPAVLKLSWIPVVILVEG